MKTSLYIMLLSLLSLGSCASQKKMQKKPPFVVEEASFQKWTNDKAESDSGIDIKILISELNDENILFKDIYFRGKISTATIENIEGKKYIIAKFSHQNFQKPDIIMHADPRKEVGNQPPLRNKSVAIEFMFELEDDEAVVSYVKKDSEKVKYTKIIGIKEK